ncbi:MAG: helix-turn-helix domain-containing protein [Tannerella sp.]|jgi:hypothetical protein|nr:helix-turn-helix domain-containing protein [Tannerella sp.]
MYIDNDSFEKWMIKLDGKVSEICKHLKSLLNTNDVFDKDEKLLDNQDLCFMLHISKRTLQRYRTEGGLPYLKYGQKIYYKASDVKEFVNRNCDYWDKKTIEEFEKKNDCL